MVLPSLGGDKKEHNLIVNGRNCRLYERRRPAAVTGEVAIDGDGAAGLCKSPTTALIQYSRLNGTFVHQTTHLVPTKTSRDQQPTTKPPCFSTSDNTKNIFFHRARILAPYVDRLGGYV